MDRIMVIQNLMMEIISKIEEERYKCIGYSHLFGVSKFAAMLAGIRGFDEADTELLAISGLMHDIAVFRGMGSKQHGQKGAEYLRELLPEFKIFTAEEIDRVCGAIAVHSDKADVSTAFNEVLKDADVLDHYYADINHLVDRDIDRLRSLSEELGLNIKTEGES